MGRDALYTHIKAIDKELAGLTPFTAEEHCIFKVREQLLKVNEKAYKPVLLAIGPYNDHGEVAKGLMQEHKLRYLKQMLKRRDESSVEAYVSALTQLEERARNCYAERIRLTPYEFVKMMLLDGCFIIELFRKWAMCKLRDEHDPIFQLDWMCANIARDLLLFENQIPFFVLTKLFLMSESSQTPLPNQSEHLGEHTIKIEQNNEITCPESSSSIDQIRRFVDLALCFFYYETSSLPFGCSVSVSSSYSTKKIKHLLCRPHTAITPPLAKIVHEHLKVGDKLKNTDFKHLLDLIHTVYIMPSGLDMELLRATEHQDVEVKFKKREIFNHLFGLIPRVASPLLAKLKNMKKGGKEKSICSAIGRLYGPKRIEDWNSIPYGIELHEAGVEFKMAEKFRDKFEENQSWELIPDAIAFQEAGIELKQAEKFLREQFIRELYQESNEMVLFDRNRNEDGKSKLCGAKFKMIKKVMHLPFLNKIENWDSIPNDREFKVARVEFKKAKKFRDIKNMINSPIPNATELKEAGVKFKKGKNLNTFAIKFRNGLLEISPLIIEDETETFMRNLIAYEQYSPYGDSKYVTDYMRMLDELIDSPKDVELLRQKGIIENYLGNDECASNMVNKLGRHVTFSSSNSIYDITSIEMNKHCEFVWNEWKAKLRRDYFNSPWALLSVLAAILLLGLAITQTVFSIIR